MSFVLNSAKGADAAIFVYIIHRPSPASSNYREGNKRFQHCVTIDENSGQGWCAGVKKIIIDYCLGDDNEGSNQKKMIKGGKKEFDCLVSASFLPLGMVFRLSLFCFRSSRLFQTRKHQARSFSPSQHNQFNNGRRGLIDQCISTRASVWILVIGESFRVVVFSCQRSRHALTTIHLSEGRQI